MVNDPVNKLDRCGVLTIARDDIGARKAKSMKILVNYGDVERSDAITDHVEARVETALELFADRVTRVEVHLRDDKKKRRGPDDNRCVMEVRLAGESPMAVEAKAGDIYDAVTQCADKLHRAVERKLDRS